MAKDKYRNQVSLIGRVSSTGISKEMPSGDTVIEFRVVIGRDDRDGVDALDIAVWRSNLKKRALGLKEDEWISVKGVIRRRFWRVGGALSSRWQVEARELTRL